MLIHDILIYKYFPPVFRFFILSKISFSVIGISYKFFGSPLKFGILLFYGKCPMSLYMTGLFHLAFRSRDLGNILIEL